MSYLVLLSLSALLLIIVFACGSDDPRRDLLGVTRIAAEVTGILTEDNDCLRINATPGSIGYAIVWQKDVFSVERRGNAVLIVDLNPPVGPPSPTVIWRLGDEIFAGGGATTPEGADYHAGAGFSERCAGPYSLVSMVP